MIKMMLQQAPAWLPYALRSRIDQWRVQWALGGIDRTPPYALATSDDADAELHLLLCKRDLRLGVVCLKSLLRLAGDVKFCATVTNDGSLDDADRKWFDRHLPNVHWASWPKAGAKRDAAVEVALEPFPRLRALYFESDFELIAKIVHPLVLGRCERIILLDADEAFFESPDRLLAFARGDVGQPLFLHDHQNEAKGTQPEVREAFEVLAEAMTRAGHRWQLPKYYFNSGLLAYRRDQLDLAVAEAYLDWLETEAPPSYRTGRLGIWFGNWTPEQTAYLAMYAAADPSPEALDEAYHLGGAPGHAFNHFLRHYIVRRRVLERLKALIRKF